MIRTFGKFVGLPLAASAAFLTLSAASAAAQRHADIAPEIGIDAVVTQCSIDAPGYWQFQNCVTETLTPQ